MDPVIRTYDDAWNAPDPDECELIEPRGRFAGRDAILERVSGFSSRFPGAKVEITTSVDEHNRFARYGALESA